MMLSQTARPSPHLLCPTLRKDNSIPVILHLPSRSGSSKGLLRGCWTNPCAIINRKRASMERLQLLIFSQDSSLVGLVRAALQDLGVAGCYFDTDSTRALEVLKSRHFDGIILDCNDLARAQEILARIRRGPSNRQTPVIAIVNDATDMRVVQSSGANFNVCKPVSPATLKTHLNKAFDAMQKKHRRYFRYAVSLTLFVGAGKEGLTSGRLINVGGEGLAVLLRRSAKPEGAVSLRFDLPSIEPYSIEAKGEVAWADAEGRIGIKLSEMPAEARRKYAEWLDVLHAQLEFRRLTEEASQGNP
jgi:CheY-like chemotaxis protein